jgi:uncharacterized protein
MKAVNVAKPFIIRDPIHSDIHFNDLLKSAINSDQFQRLRRITQNGLLYLVYPGMRHSRFEHSIGASYLAGVWFDSLKEKFADKSINTQHFFNIVKDFRFEDGADLKVTDTIEHYCKLFGSTKHSERWRNIVMLAALFHDLGHGPLSHTFDLLGLCNCTLQEVKDMVNEKTIKKFILSERFSSKKKLRPNTMAELEHEDISLIYIDLIATKAKGPLGDFLNEEKNLLAICALVHKDFRKFLLDPKKHAQSGGKEKKLTLLFAQFISGLFDVDRMDYLNRDSFMAGVRYGYIESEKIMTAMVPILFEKQGVLGSGLAIKSRFVHILDHFLVCLYSMYPQLYHHPTNEQIQHEIIQIVSKLKETNAITAKKFTLSWHKDAGDWDFLNIIDQKSNGLLKAVINRKARDVEKVVSQVYASSEAENILGGKAERIEVKARPMIKDASNVWLVEHTGKISSWREISMVADRLSSTNYSPNIWWRNSLFTQKLKKLENSLTSTSKRKTNKRAA